MVKCAAPPTFRYICFDHLEMRLYKGEGTVNLIAYYPYALATFSPNFLNATTAVINNTGDLGAFIKIFYTISNATGLTTIQLKDMNNNQLNELKFRGFTK